MRTQPLLAGLTLVVVAFVVACDGGGPSQPATVEPRQPTPLAPLSSAPSPKPAPTETQETAVVPVTPDPYELYVINLDGGDLSLISSSPGLTRGYWSPNGERLAFTVIRGSAASKLHIVTPPDRSGGAVAEFAGSVGPVVWSPSREWLALVALQGGNRALEVMRDDGTDRMTLITSEGYDHPLHVVGWLQGERLMAISAEPSGGVLVELDVATGQARDVWDLPGRVVRFDVSPDGASVAMTTATASDSCGWASLTDLWLIEVASGQAHPLIGETCGLTDVAWSQDGEEVAYTVVVDQLESGAGGVYVVNASTRAVRQLTSPRDGFDAGLDWLPDGGGLLVRRSDCWACEGGPPTLIEVPAAGGQERVIVDQGYHSVSPDSRSLVIVEDGLQLTDMEGGERRTLLPGDPDWLYAGPAWAPDGRRLSFVRYHSEAARQFEVNIDGTGFARLPNLDSPYSLKVQKRVPSPDGSKIAALNFFLKIEDLASGEVKTLTPVNPSQVSWSLDSRRLAFTAGAGYAQPDLYVVNGDGANLRQVTDDVATEYAPAFSSDGRFVAFLRPVEGPTGREGTELLAVNVETLEQRVLVTQDVSGGSVDGRPVWSPDGTRLALFMSAAEGPGIYIINVDGSQHYLLVATEPIFRIREIRWLDDQRLYFLSVPDFI